MKIIDFHSHFFARPFFEALAAQSPLPGDPEEKLAVIRRTGIELPPADVKAHLARWVDDLDTKGVAHLVTFASLPEEIPAVAEATRLADGRITPVALVNPRAPDSGTRVEGLMDVQGFAGVLVFPALHHFHIAGQESRAMLQALDARRGIIYVHCGLLRLNAAPFEPPPMRPDTRDGLLRFFAEENRRLSDLLERDLSHWDR